MNLNQHSKNVQQKIAHYLDIPKEIILDLPKITLIGDIQLYIENHRGIIEYTSEKIRIAIAIGELEIGGEKLVIRNITREEMYLDGHIKSVQFNR
ncbi:MAG: sporulation protein YqfC [Bacillota bacterium]|jgi:sporulation protein YqfC|uniref:Sporulation protein YqfC n=1 Tax=Thermanaerosceptrum fracticalcis TaxID=1712410 RepID=A0A7G6E235_THEFR|nr:sporulation protein YqfC [Thermanaerosceptrum fracticalcis]MBZ4653761.1 yqfC [Peptococcaceae bacterium]QNB46139.1 sporulation protein YqfC [Thermanaerosceptrum fracticalcis]